MTRLLPLLLLPLLLAQAAAPDHSPAHQQFVFAYRLLQRDEVKLAVEAFDEYLGKYPSDAKRGDALYYRALLAQRGGELDKAVALLNGAPTPTLVPAHAPALLRAQCHLSLNQPLEALKILEPLPTDPLDPLVRATVLQVRGVAYQQSGNLPAAEAQLLAAADLDSPLRARALLDLGRVRAALDQTDPALTALEQALKLADPGVTPWAAQLAGDLAYRAARYEQAMTFYDLVIKNHQAAPQFAPSVLGAMWSALQARKFQAVTALDQTHRAALRGEDQTTALYLAGSALQESDQPAPAMEVFRSCLAQASNHPLRDKALYRLARCAMALQQYPTAEQTLDQLRQEHPTTDLLVDADFLRATALTEQGRGDEAVTLLSGLIDRGPGQRYHAQSLLRRAALHDAAGRLDAASKDYARFLQAAPDSPDAPAVGVRGIDIDLRLSRWEQAQKSAQALLASPALDATTQEQLLYRLMLARVRLDKPAAALEAAESLLTRFPAGAHAGATRYQRGLLRMTMGQPDEALPDLLAAADDKSLSVEMRGNALRLASMRLRQLDRTAEAAETLARLANLLGSASLTTTELLWTGRFLVANAQWRDALAHLELVLKADARTTPALERAEATYLIARCLSQMDQRDAAIRRLQELVAAGQGFELEARLDLARLLVQAQRFDDALSEYEGLVTAPTSRVAATATFESALLHRQKAQAFREAGDQASAGQSLAAALKLLKRLTLLHAHAPLSPLPELAFVEQSEVAAELGQTDESSAALSELVKQFPQGAFAHYAKAVLAAQQGKKGEAAFLLRHARQNTSGAIDPRLETRMNRLRQEVGD